MGAAIRRSLRLEQSQHPLRSVRRPHRDYPPVNFAQRLRRTHTQILPRVSALGPSMPRIGNPTPSSAPRSSPREVVPLRTGIPNRDVPLGLGVIRRVGQHATNADDLPMPRHRDPDVLKEHGLPHFHARHGSEIAVFAIEPLEVIRGKLAPNIDRLVRDWAALHQAELLRNREHARTGTALEPIDQPS